MANYLFNAALEFHFNISKSVKLFQELKCNCFNFHTFNSSLISESPTHFSKAFKLNCLFNCYSELPGDWTNFITFRESLVILCVSPVQYVKVSRLNGVNWMFQMSSFNPIKILLIHLQTLAEFNKIIKDIW